MNLESLYQQVILDHYKNPHAAGLREPFSSEVRHHNPTCGDECTMRAHLVDDEGEVRIADISYDAVGCSISVAGASMMSDMVIGHTPDEALARYDAMVQMMQSRGEGTPDEEVLGDAVALQGVSQFPARVKCALLGWAAMKDAVLQAQAGLDQSNKVK